MNDPTTAADAAESTLEIVRDYWRLSVQTDSDESFVVSMCGRRRITECYWRELTLSPADFQRFGHSMRNALTLQRGFAAEVGAEAPLFPSSAVLGVCSSARYLIELSETRTDLARRAIDTTVYTLKSAVEPCLSLAGDHLPVFVDDLQAASLAAEAFPFSSGDDVAFAERIESLDLPTVAGHVGRPGGFAA